MICNLGTLPKGANATVAIDVIPTTAGPFTNDPRVTGAESDPNPENDSAPIMTIVGPSLKPTSRATCDTDTLGCALQLACNRAKSLRKRCINNVKLFVRLPGGRLNGELVAARATKRKRILFAAAITNIPPGRIQDVMFTLTKRGKQTATRFIQQGKRKLRGTMEIRNSAGGIDIIRLRVRLR